MSVQAGFAELGVCEGRFFLTDDAVWSISGRADIEAEYLADYLQHLGQTPVPKIPRVAWPQLMSLIELTMDNDKVLENSSWGAEHFALQNFELKTEHL